TLSEGQKLRYTDYLRTTYPESGGKADLVGFFFRRGFQLLRLGATLGLLATKTISQGDTRSSGLRWICVNGGSIYSTLKRIVWPGEASRIVVAIHVVKGVNAEPPAELDGRKVPIITAFLFHAGGHDDPAPLRSNLDKSFQGSVIRGMGFTFDDA